VYYDLNEGLGADGVADTGDEWGNNTAITTVAQTGSSGVKTYRWNPMPSIVTNKGVIKITDASNETEVYSVGGTQQKTLPLAAAQLFKVGAPFDVTDPELGHTAYAEETHTITWNNFLVSGVTKVALYYTNNSGAPSPTWNPITTDAQNTGTYNWNPVPSALADLNNTNRIRITQYDPLNEAGTQIDSEGDFSILGKLIVTVPGAGTESWGVNTTQRIKFKKKGALQTVDLYYSYNGQEANYAKINGASVNIAGAPNDGATGEYWYDWTIDPDTTNLTSGFSGKIRVKAVTPTTQVAVAGTQQNAIEIKGTVTLLDPDGAITPMDVASNYTIRWQKFGAVSNVQIHYSTDGGVAGGGSYPVDNLIYDGPATDNGSTFVWSVPDRVGTNLRIRVRHKENTNVWDESITPFRIKGKLQLTEPEGTGLTYAVNTTQTIRWTSTGTFGTSGGLELHYDRDGDFGTAGDTYPVTPLYQVNNCTPAGTFPYQCNGTASFLIEDKIASTVKVRIRGTGTESDIQWTSTNPFKIIGKIDAITSPAAGAVWNVGDLTKQIKWSSTGTITNVKIEYKTSAVGAWIDPPIVADDGGHTAGNNIFDWTAGVPDEKTEDAYIRISDVNYPEVVLVSSAFSIRPIVTVTTPTVGQILNVGSNTTLLNWSVNSTTVDTVKVLYSTDGGATYPDPANVIASAVAVGNGIAGITWNIPVAAELGNNTRVKIVDEAVGFSEVYGQSAIFKLKGGMTVTAPVGLTTTWTAGTTNSIAWNYVGGLGSATIYYDLDSTDEAGWTLISPVSTKALPGSSGTAAIDWALPDNVSNKARVKVVATSVVDPELTVTAVGADFRIGAQFDITAPENGAPVYAENTVTQITWNTDKGTGITKVKLYYTNDLTNWIEITPAGGIANTGSYDWNPIPRGLAELSTTTHKVKITQFDPENEANVFNIGGGTAFPILGTLTVTTPSTGAESWGVNVPQTLKFKKKGNLQKADLYYSYDGGAGNYVKITPTPIDISDETGTPDGGGNYSFSWPLDPATTALTNGFTGTIKAKAVEPTTQTSVEGISSNIEVKGTVTLLAPTGAVTPMDVGSIFVIQWQKFGAVNNVQVHFSTNGGLTYPPGNLIYDGPSTVDGSTFAWDVPDQIGTNVKIRIRHKENTNVKDESSAPFRIKGKLQLNQPDNAGISWNVSSTQQVQWTTTGTFTPLEIQYATDGNFGGANVFDIKPTATVTNCAPASPAIVCSGSANFEIEDKITAGAKVRIRGTGTEQDVEDISTNTFKIVGALDVTAPETGQIWYVGETDKAITWDATGTIPNVNIGYKTSVGAACNYVNIKANDTGHTAGSNTYNWTTGVADEKTEAGYVCIQDKDFPEIVNVSAAPFSIRPKVTVTAPVTTDRIKVGSNNPNLIKFTVTGTKTTSVNILYTSNGGADGYDKTIASNVDVALGVAGIDWNNVPDTITTNAKIKVVDPASTGQVVFGLSDTFKIVGEVNIINPPAVAPTPKVMLKKGQVNYPIQWTKKGSFPNVAIRYSLDGGTNFTEQITAQAPAGNSSNPLEPNEFVWLVIPNTPSPNVVVRVADYDDPETKSLSGVLAIQSNLNVTQPDGGEVWAVGDSQDIIWTTDGTTLRVKLEYATNGGGLSGNWAPVVGAEDILNAGFFSWEIPNALSNTMKVRVVDMADPDNWNESGATFKVRANFTILTPNGNADPALTDKLTVGSSVPIQWYAVGSVTTVKLQYSFDGGVYQQITTPTNATGINAITGQPGCVPAPCWNWQIPDSISSAVRVRVVYEPDITTYDSSDYNFTIQGQLAFNPALPESGDETWYVGDTKTLTWTKAGTIPLIRLQYSKVSNSSGFIDIEQDVGGTEYSWLIPNDLGGTNPIDPSIWIRALNMNTDKPTIMALSGSIDLRGKFAISSPIVTDKWQVDDTNIIKWTPSGTMGTVRLEYSVDDFVTPLPVLGPLGESAANLAAGAHGVEQSFSWKVPNNISNNAKVRITTNTAGEADPTDSPAFKIAGGFKVLTPNGGAAQFFEVDGSTSITWERHGSITNAKLQYSTNGFNNESEVFDIVTVPATDLSYTWTPIPDKIGSNVKVRIVDPLYNGTTVHTNADVSDQAFEIRGKIDINTPAGSETWLITSDHMLQWTKHGTISSVKVEYDTDPADAFDFTDPGTGLPNYVKDAAGNPASSVAGTTFNWRIPDRKSINKARIKVTNISDPDHVFTISPFFTIRGGFAWSNPVAAGQVFEVSTTGVITWTTFGTINNVDLQYSNNDGFSYVPVLINNNPLTPATGITNPQGAGGTFNWVIPDSISKDVYLKINDSTDPDATQTSVKVKIAGVIHIDQPDGTNRWGAGTTQNITWHRDGSIQNLKIEYSLNNGTDWIDPPISASILGSAGLKAWLVPATVSPTVKVRISDVITDSGTTPVVSPAFKIVGSFSFTAPGAGEVWPVTTGEIANPTRNIVWATQGVVPNVNLRYSATGAAPWTLINQNPIADGGAGGSYPWTVPDDISSSVKILIEDAIDNETNQPSPQFAIRGDLALTAPVGSEKWGVNSNQAVTWLRNGSISEVYLFYSMNGAAGPWFPILNPGTGLGPIPNTGSFVWSVPDSMTQNARIRIQNVAGPSVTKESPANFKIMARFDVTAPDGGETVNAGTNYAITWNKWGSGATNVKIELATNGDAPTPTFDKVITANTANDGSHTWPVSVEHVTPGAKIRISDVNDPDTANTSASSFIIRATFVMDPNIGTTDLKVGDTFRVFWSKQGNIPQVKLQYSPDNFFSDVRFIDPTADGLVPNSDSCTSDPTKGCYEWIVPDIEDNKDTAIRFKISDPNDPDATATSNPFNIIPKFTVTAPDGNANPSLTDKLKVATPYTITWTSTSTQAKTPQVTLLYSTTGGAPYSKTIATVDNTGSYNWVTANGGVPDDISSQVKVRVIDASDSVAYDDSSNNFKIISDFTLSTPDGGDTYDVGETIPITWTNKGTVANVELSYSIAGSDFSSPVVIQGTLANGTGFGTTHNWIVPNAIGTNVRVKVRSLSDDGEVISNANFRIRGKLVPVAPALNDKALIGQSFTIQWQSYGTMPTVKIHYDTANGTGGFPNQISASAPNCTPAVPETPCTGSFVWNNIPDTPAAQAKIRVMDTRANESDVLAITDTFSIIGNFTVVTPNGGQDWRVNESHDIVWTWGGTIPVVKLFYTKQVGDPDVVTWTEIDPLVTKNYSTDGNPQNGANNTVQRQYLWTVPDDISPTVRVKVADATNLAVYDVSNNSFKIRGDFTITSPNGNANINLAERWVTSVYTINEGQDITWTTAGTIPNVKLQYSNDNFVNDLHLITATTPNTGTYRWEIPDAVLKDGNGKYAQYNPVKVRVLDVNDEEVYDASNDPFKIDYYNVKWIIRDLSTYNLLGELGVMEVKGSDPDFVQWQEAGIGVTQLDPGGYTRIVPTPAGTWVATWSKTGYGDLPQVVTLSKNNPTQDPPLPLDPEYQLLMETTTVHIYASEGRFTYDPEADRLDIVAWLARDGSILTGVVNARVYIFEGATIVTGAPVVLSMTGNKETGLWNAQINNATAAPYNLKSGVTYVAKVQTQIASQVPNDVWYQTPTSFEITTPRKLQDVIDEVNRVLDKPMSEVAADLNATLAAQTAVITDTLEEQTTTIKEEMGKQTDLIQDAVDDFTASVAASLVALETGAKASQTAGEQLKKTAERFSWKTSCSPNPALSGDTITIQAQGLAGLFPILSIYNFENKQVVASGAMIESTDNPGNYSFTFMADASTFQAGKAYTFIVSEDVTGGLVSGSGFVESTSLSTIAGLVASAPGAESAAKKALDAIKGLEAVMTKGGDMAGVKDQMSSLKDVIQELPDKLKDLMKGKDSGMKDVTKVVNSISAQLTTLAGNEGYDISKLMSKAISDAPSIKDLRKKSDEIATGVDIVQKTIESKLGQSDEPIIAVSYTSGSVIVRVVVVNPSDKKNQEIPVKVYLPQETKPEDVMDKGNMDFGYDEERAVYYVYKDKVMLEPKETRIFEVELKDIWFIPEETLTGLRTQTEKILKRLEGTPYFDQGKLIVDTIYGRLDRIATTQADESVNKELHIGLYRANLVVVDKIKEDIERLEKMLVAVGAPPAPEMLAESKLNLKTPSRATTWFIIFAIMVFIGLLGIVFFFTWQSQVKESQDISEDKDETTPPKSDEDSGQSPPAN